MEKKESSSTSWVWYVAFVLAVIYIGVNHNPLERFVDAGSVAYYQGRIAFEKGAPFERAKLSELADHGKITMRDYSKVVFPAFLKTLGDSGSLMPQAEQDKSTDQLREEFLATVKGANAKVQN